MSQPPSDRMDSDRDAVASPDSESSSSSSGCHDSGTSSDPSYPPSFGGFSLQPSLSDSGQTDEASGDAPEPVVFDFGGASVADDDNPFASAFATPSSLPSATALDVTALMDASAVRAICGQFEESEAQALKRGMGRFSLPDSAFVAPQSHELRVLCSKGLPVSREEEEEEAEWSFPPPADSGDLEGVPLFVFDDDGLDGGDPVSPLKDPEANSGSNISIPPRFTPPLSDPPQRIWRSTRRRRARTVPLSAEVSSFGWGDDDREEDHRVSGGHPTAATLGEEEVMVMFPDLPGAHFLPRLSGDQKPRHRTVVDLSSQEHEAVLCVVGTFRGVACFDPKTLTLKREIPTARRIVSVVSIPPEEGGREEDLIAIGEGEKMDYEVLLYSPHQIGSPFQKLPSHSSLVYGLCYVSPRFIVSGSGDPPPELFVSDVSSGKKVMDLKDAPKSITTTTSSSTRQRQVRGSPQRGDGFVFVGGGDHIYGDTLIRHYDLGRSERTNEVVTMFEGPKEDDWARVLSYSPETNLLFSSSCDATVLVWSVQDATCLHALQLSNVCFSLLFDPKKRLIFCGVYGVIEVWDCRQTKKRVRMFNHRAATRSQHVRIYDLAQIDDETYASIGDEDFSVATWTDRGKIVARAKTSGHNYGVCFVGETQSPVVAQAQDERIDFLLSCSSVFWGVQVRGRHCILVMTSAMMFPD